MLKRNLVRTGLFSHGMLLLVPNLAVAKIEPSHSSHYDISTRVLPYVKYFSNADSLLASSAQDAEHGPTIQLNKSATKFLKKFLKDDGESLADIKARSGSYFRIIDTVFKQYGLPSELKYLAVIESDLKTSALSRVGAKGIWQLMPVTARELGLKVSGKYDERTHVYKSTVAAAKYLKSLYGDFGDWLLVMAAYNSGPGTVMNAMKRAGTRNFWALQGYLPSESRGHVKRFISVHYYFEGKGSVATMTKTETTAYNKAWAEFNLMLSTKKMVKDSTTVVMTAHQ